MPNLVCSQCSSTNPAEATYCYFDGVRLNGAGGGNGPINAATQSFPIPFTFPSGMVCRNFDQFATACQQQWTAALGLLKDGLLSSFFGGMGRADLAQAAKEAARFPDQDRGLDQLLDKLPTQALQAPKLRVEPSEVNLGELTIGTDRTIDLHLTNMGMRLVFGTIASDCKWLKLGEGPGSSQKLFQFGAETVIPVQILGKQVRAGNKPLEGQLLIESNGGSLSVPVKALVPITPLKGGLLAGSVTPRQVAEKARANPTGAAPFFEDGTVARWFEANGWTYPVQGPSAKGLGAVQQFFEALGLAKAPKVQINTPSIALKGAAGQSVHTTIEVSTQEKKPVYAHATCEQPWVNVSKVKLAGRLATITVAVPEVPARPGETLQTKIMVAGNGNQRFTVPFSLTVSGKAAASNPFAELDGVGASTMTIQPGAKTVSIPKSSNPFADLSPAETAVTTKSPSSSGGKSPSASGIKSAPQFTPVVVAKRPERKTPVWLHALPLILLLAAVVALPLRDAFGTAPKRDEGGGFTVQAPSSKALPLDPTPYVVILFDYKLDKKRPLEVEEPPYPRQNFNFGLRALVPDDDGFYRYKPILFGRRGHTNNTRIKVDDHTTTFGKSLEGEWVEPPKIKPWLGIKQEGFLSFYEKSGVGTWRFRDVNITQSVRIVPGEAVEDKYGFRRLQNVCEVFYKLENKGKKAHNVGLRVLLDTLIGDEKGADGAPFTVPGLQGLVTDKKDFSTPKEVPDFVTVLEKEDLAKPGIVVQLNLRNAGMEPPSRVLLTRWPGADVAGEPALTDAIEKWEVPLVNIAKGPENKDSSVVMYWPAKPLEPGPKAARIVGYSYGLGSSAARAGGQLSISVGGNFSKDGEFSVIAMMKDAAPNETITLELPSELTLQEGGKTQRVPPPQDNRPRPVNWRVRSTAVGSFVLTVRTSSGLTQKIHVTITEAGESIF